MNDFNVFLDALSGDDFSEKPASLEEFVTSKDYLGLPPLSKYQYEMIRASTQFYKRETLHNIYGEEDGEKIWKQTCSEVILQLGKGSGKDYTSTIACAYMVHLLLCLEDPARYYGKPPGDAIDIINIAINAIQANRVFFKGFNQRIEKSPWFQVGRFLFLIALAVVFFLLGQSMVRHRFHQGSPLVLVRLERLPGDDGGPGAVVVLADLGDVVAAPAVVDHPAAPHADVVGAGHGALDGSRGEFDRVPGAAGEGVRGTALDGQRDARAGTAGTRRGGAEVCGLGLNVSAARAEAGRGAGVGA